MRWIIIILLTTIKFAPQLHPPQFHSGSVTVAASYQYSSPSIFERIIFGTNYRKEWETPATMPVFDIRKTNFRIIGIGGGQQTTSLDLLDDKNKEWRLRSIDKNVVLKERIITHTFLRRIVQEHISGAYPYASLSVSFIERAAGVLAPEQTLVFVPDDSTLGAYRSVIANRIFVLMEHQLEEQDNITTMEMLARMDTCKEYFVDQEDYLKARLVDWLVADWDRHEDQWRWIEKNTDKGTAFHIVPRDHDQAFFRSNGWLVRLFSLFLMPHLNKFTDKIRGIKALSRKTWSWDKRFTDRLSKEDWERIIKEFQNNITDSVIEMAIKKQPHEIVAIRGNGMIKKLQSRRDGMLKQVMKYYAFLHS